MMRWVTGLLIAAAGTGVLLLDKTLHRAPAVYVLDSLHRAMIDSSPPDPAESRVEVSAARGESAGFQIVIYGGAAGMDNVDAKAMPAVGGSGLTLPLRLYREHYVAISNPSREGEGGAKAGIYPDALIPFRNPFTGEPLTGGRYVPVPFRVAAHNNQVIYGEIAVPEDAAPGAYASAISLTSSAGALANIPVSLTVWNFVIPKKPSLESAFNDYDSERLIGPANYYGYSENSPEHQSLAAAMDEDLLAHRLVPEIPMYSYFDVASDGHLRQSAEQNRRLLAILKRPERSDFKLYLAHHFPFRDPLGADRQRTIIYLRDAYAWFERFGLLEKVWLRVNDEPEKEAEFREARAFADLIHEANPNFKVAITGGMDHDGFDRYLYGHFDTFMVGFDSFDPQKVRREQSRGEQFWSYTAVVQGTENPSPYWQIEFPLLDFRIAPWMNFRYGLHGLLYWTSAKWDEIGHRGHSPWSDPCSLNEHGTCYNGDGMLVYPGKEVNYVIPAGAYGELSPKAVYGPIPSLRLKALRDGMQDYELLTLAARKDPQAAMDAAIDVACDGNREPGDVNHNCFHSWNTDPGELLKIRARLAAIILR
jgi:hypothetical protein